MSIAHRTATFTATFALLAAIIPAADSQAVPITNPGFELPDTTNFGGTATGWTFGGTTGGIWDINNAPSGFWTVPAPEGDQVAYVSPAPAPGGPGSLSQTLTDTLEPDTLYTLSGWVGHPIGYGSSAGTTYTVELRAGGNPLSSTFGTGPEGFFTPFVLYYDSTGSAYLGQTLSIHLLSSQAQTAFDAITLTDVPVPEPATLTLVAFAAAPLLRRRR